MKRKGTKKRELFHLDYCYFVTCFAGNENEVNLEIGCILRSSDKDNYEHTKVLIIIVRNAGNFRPVKAKRPVKEQIQDSPIFNH